MFEGRLIILKQWSPSIGLERDLLTVVLVWVRFPSLHLKFWSNTVLSKTASLIGIPLFMDKATNVFERIVLTLKKERCTLRWNMNELLLPAANARILSMWINNVL